VKADSKKAPITKPTEKPSTPKQESPRRSQRKSASPVKMISPKVERKSTEKAETVAKEWITLANKVVEHASPAKLIKAAVTTSPVKEA
jgi:hypothetical protein